MSNLLNLTLKTNTEYKNIPQEIGDQCILFGECLIIHAEDFSHGGMNSEEINRHILHMWLGGKGLLPVSWWQLSQAFQRIGRNDLYQIVTNNCHSLELTMDTLLNFPAEVTKSANIPREVGVKYFDFGIHLLQDPTGAHLYDLEHKLSKDGEEINKHILMEWLEGKGRPVKWNTLVEVLFIIRMGELAKQIYQKYIFNK